MDGPPCSRVRQPSIFYLPPKPPQMAPLSIDHLKVADMTTEIDTITETIEVSLTNLILNKEIKATNMLKHNPKAFFQFAQSKKKSQDTIGPLINRQKPPSQ